MRLLPFFSFIILLMIRAFAFCQQFSTIAVPLKVISTIFPFRLNQSFAMLTTDTAGFKGIPSDLEEFKIQEASFQGSAIKLFILHGITRQNKQIVVFDTDLDRDFTGEKNYTYETDNIYNRQFEKSILDTTSAVEIKLSSQMKWYIKPNIYNCCVTYKTPEGTKWHLFLQRQCHYEGNINLTGKDFKIAINKPPYAKAIYAKFLVKTIDSSFEEESQSSPSYDFRNPALVENHEISIDSINANSDTAWIKVKVSLNDLGNHIGDHAIPINAQTTQDKRFISEEYKGNYVLLDFWGTWCKPCLESLPKIRRLNDQYKSKNFKLVSIAFDKKNDYKKLLSTIKKQNMDWINLFDDQELVSNISTQFNVSCFPTTFLIDPNGKIVYRSCGVDDFSKIEEMLRSYLVALK
jgi:thiol-disulfide isomerase/thioredoxin